MYQRVNKARVSSPVPRATGLGTLASEPWCFRSAGWCARRGTRSGVLGGVAIALIAGLVSCERRGIQEQAVAKGIERVPPAAAETPESERDRESPWRVPAGWTLDPTPRSMRLATYLAPDPAGPVEVAVTRFAGRVGGELANLNRWRDQMGLPPIALRSLDGALVRFGARGFEGYEARIESPAGVMLASAVYEQAIDQTWFVRATLAAPAAADRIQPDLFAMARSIVDSDPEEGP